MKLMSPNDTEIVGTLEIVSGVAGIFGDILREADGTFAFDYDGETKIDWDSQKTVIRRNASGKGERVFVDENGEEFLESELTLVEEG